MSTDKHCPLFSLHWLTSIDNKIFFTMPLQVLITIQLVADLSYAWIIIDR